MQTIKTVFHAYSFDIGKPDEAAAYKELCAKLKDWPHPLEAFAGNDEADKYAAKIAELDGQTVELETTHLFNNQWNTSEGSGNLRVFDWRKIVPWPNGYQKMRRGHWLEQTDEMREIRRNTMACGYCGKQEPAAKGYVFCPHCIGPQYLKAEDLPLTRMRAVDENDHKHRAAPLTEAEAAHLLPIYKQAQADALKVKTGKDRLNAFERVERDYQSSVRKATIKRDGYLWLLNHGLRTDNVIFYDHTNKWAFGWREPVTDDIRDALLDVISEFPFQYEIKCRDGKTLEGNYQGAA
jgi:hypothetical protein